MSLSRKVNRTRTRRPPRGAIDPAVESATRTKASAQRASKASTVQDVPSKNAQRTRRLAGGLRASMNRSQSRGSR